MPNLPVPGVTTSWGDDLNAAIESLHLTGTHAARPSTGLVTGTLYSCSDHGLVYRWNGSAWTDWTPRRGLLAVKQHNPGTAVTYSTTATTPTDLDATNLAVTFTAPTSGSVVVRLGSAMTQTTAAKAAYWHIREGSTTIATRWIYFFANAAGQADLSASAAFHITGLTAGATYTYTWAQSTDSGGAARVYAGGTIGPAIMEVLAA